MKNNTRKKDYTLDELGELIVPHQLTKEEAEEIRLFIETHKKKLRLKKEKASNKKVAS